MPPISNDAINNRLRLSLEQKEEHALRVLRVFYSHPSVNGKIYISFSGGKDSTVLLHLVRRQFHDVPAVFCDTGLEFPEIRQFVNATKNVIIIKPKIQFQEVLDKYGFPFPSKEQAYYIEQVKHSKSLKLIKKRLNDTNFCISKKWRFLINSSYHVSSRCCDILKKRPFQKFEKEFGLFPIVGTKIKDSSLRRQRYAVSGCNSFDSKIVSKPLSIWTDKDVWDYIQKYKLSYSSIYSMGYERTGCIFCLFGISFEKKPNRMERLKQTHPKLWNFVMEQLGYSDFLNFLGIETGG